MKNAIQNVKTKMAVMSAVMTVAMAQVAFADVSEDAVKTQLGTTLDTVFTMLSVGLGVLGAFKLIPGIIAFVNASVNHEGGDRSNAAGQLAVGIVIMMLAISITMFKTPIKTMIGA